MKTHFLAALLIGIVTIPVSSQDSKPKPKTDEREADPLYDCDILREHAKMKALTHRNDEGKVVENCRTVYRHVIATGGGHSYWYTRHRIDCPVRMGKVQEPSDADGYVQWVFEAGFSPAARGSFLWPFELKADDILWFKQVKEDLTSRLVYIREAAQWVETPTETAGSGWKWETPKRRESSREKPKEATPSDNGSKSDKAKSSTSDTVSEPVDPSKDRELMQDCDIIREHLKLKALTHRNKEGYTLENCQLMHREVMGGGGGHNYWYTKHRKDCPIRLGRVRELADPDNFMLWVLEVGFTPAARGGFLWPFELKADDKVWLEQVKQDLTSRLAYIREGARWVETPKDSAGVGWKWELPAPKEKPRPRSDKR